MEELADKYSERCTLTLPQHSKLPEFMYYEGNTAQTAGVERNVTEAASTWYDQRVNYTFANDSCEGLCYGYKRVSQRFLYKHKTFAFVLRAADF